MILPCISRLFAQITLARNRNCRYKIAVPPINGTPKKRTPLRNGPRRRDVTSVPDVGFRGCLSIEGTSMLALLNGWLTWYQLLGLIVLIVLIIVWMQVRKRQ